MPEQAKIKVLGIGDSGNSIVNRMIEEGVKHVEFMQINTDSRMLKMSKTPNVIQIGKLTTKGLGAGSDASVGQRAVIEEREEIKEALKGTDVVFLTTGMGGGTGTGALPTIAQIANELGILTIAIITKPFTFEGRIRTIRAERGIESLERYVDALIIISNNSLLDVVSSTTSIKDAFKITDKILKQGIQSITDLITTTGNINIDFADVQSIMKNKGGAYMGIGEASGTRAIAEAVEQAIDNPLTEIKIDNAIGVIINITGNEDISLTEINDSIRKINNRVNPDANIIFGTIIDNSLGDTVKATIIATGIKDMDEIISESL